MDETSMTGFAHRDLVYQGLTIGRIHRRLRRVPPLCRTTGDSDDAAGHQRHACGSLLPGGFLLVRRMIRPMRVLESHMRKAVSGSAEPIPPGQFSSRDREVASLFRGYNALVKAERERADQPCARRGGKGGQSRTAGLGDGSRDQQSFGRALQRHRHAEEARRCSGRAQHVDKLIERGLGGIRDVVEERLPHTAPSERNGRSVRMTSTM